MTDFMNLHPNLTPVAVTRHLKMYSPAIPPVSGFPLS